MDKNEISLMRKSKRIAKKIMRKCNLNSDPNVAVLMNVAGMGKSEAKGVLKDANKCFGISSKDYIKLGMWKLSGEEQQAIWAKELKNKEIWNKRVEFVMAKTGWTREKTISEIKAAKKDCGITSKEYVANKFYKYDTMQEISLSCDPDDGPIIIKDLKKKAYIKAVMDKTGWSIFEAEKKMREARDSYGVGYWAYAYYSMYNMTDEECKEFAENRRKQAERKKRRQELLREQCIQTTMQNTGWSREKAAAHIDDTVKQVKCNYIEYQDYRFYNLTLEEQKNFFLMYHTDRIRARYNLDVNLNYIMGNKDLADKHFAEFINRRWCPSNGISFDDFCNTFNGCKKLFYKPKGLCHGSGAKPIDLTPENMCEVYNELINLPEGVVEEYVVQHHKMNEMSPTAVNTIRIASISSYDAIDDEGNHAAIVFSTLKMGGKTGCVDNLIGGGVGAAVDVETGKLCTVAVDHEGNPYTHHPVTGTEIIGFDVPMYNEAKEMVLRAIKTFNMTGYFGWDVAITENGPMLIEVNSRPGSSLLILPNLPTDKAAGKMETMRKYLDYIEKTCVF